MKSKALAPLFKLARLGALLAPVAAVAGCSSTGTTPGFSAVNAAPRVSSHSVPDNLPMTSCIQNFSSLSLAAQDQCARTNLPAVYGSSTARDITFDSRYAPGTIVISNSDYTLLLITGKNTARSYRIAIGVDGKAISAGTSFNVSAKKTWPTWTPSASQIAAHPEIRSSVKFNNGTLAGGPWNPLSNRALYLGNTAYRIHGTTAPWSIGQSESSGCIRLLNEDAEDLFNRVPVGARVVVVSSMNVAAVATPAFPALTAAA